MATLNVKNLPDALYKKLRRRARAQRRSVAREVITILDEALESPRAVSILTLRGLGKEQWRDIEPAAHVRTERGSWD